MEVLFLVVRIFISTLIFVKLGLLMNKILLYNSYCSFGGVKMNKNKFIFDSNNFSVPFCAVTSENGVFYDNDKLSLVGKILNKFISGYGEFSVDYRDVLAGVGIEDGECILIGMPIFYEKKNNVTYENIDIACSNETMNIYDSIKNIFCGERHILEDEQDLNLVDSVEWNFNPYFVGLLELSFSVSGFPKILFNLLIDVQSGYVLLCTGNNVYVYMINNDVRIFRGRNDKVIMRYCYGGGPFNRPNKNYMQWLEYNLNNPDDMLSFDTYYKKFVNKQNILEKILSGKLKI